MLKGGAGASKSSFQLFLLFTGATEPALRRCRVSLLASDTSKLAKLLRVL